MQFGLVLVALGQRQVREPDEIGRNPGSEPSCRRSAVDAGQLTFLLVHPPRSWSAMARWRRQYEAVS
ncbi:hypothetical protein [Actinopolymorpha pittospori]|uniref:Uncharacterized protein n=1 Tax=Actinopolymorpha pittospori TaxID=648752 RepID=A0A927RCC8_9ACTN|nr:hypothetical protein [Actinopolymorpha pittospori]MBE1606990.1 hypothetical protein [Actinopolymorpha pittospori]